MHIPPEIWELLIRYKDHGRQELWLLSPLTEHAALPERVSIIAAEDEIPEYVRNFMEFQATMDNEGSVGRQEMDLRNTPVSLKRGVIVRRCGLVSTHILEEKIMYGIPHESWTGAKKFFSMLTPSEEILDYDVPRELVTVLETNVFFA